MPATKTDGTWTISKPHGPARFRHPFSGETNFQSDVDRPIVIEQDYLQLAGEYRSRRDAGEEPSLGDRWDMYENNPDYGDTRVEGALFVRESDASPIVRGMLQFTRTYATKPPTLYTYESFAWRVPGLIQSTDAFLPGNITIESSTELNGDVRLQLGLQHGFNPGQRVLISYLARREYAFDQAFYTQLEVGRKIKSVTSTTITVKKIRDPLFDSFRWLSLQPERRDPQTKVVASRIERKFFLVGTGDEADFNAPDELADEGTQALQFRDETGKITDTIGPNTTPISFTEWDELRSPEEDGEPAWVPVEDSIIRQWMGPIWEVASRQARAQ